MFNEKTLILERWRRRCGGKRVFTFNFASSRADKKPAGQKEMFTKLNWETERVIDYLPAREETRICVSTKTSLVLDGIIPFHYIQHSHQTSILSIIVKFRELFAT